MAVTYEPLATTTLSSTTASITFSGISAGYTDLRLVFTPTTPVTGNHFLRFNSDTSSSYSHTVFAATGTAQTVNGQQNASYIFVNWAGVGITTTPHLYTYDIFSYNGSTNKSVLIVSSEDENGSGRVGLLIGMWRNVSAIDTITLSTQGTTFDIGTTLTLYGILRA